MRDRALADLRASHAIVFSLAAYALAAPEIAVTRVEEAARVLFITYFVVCPMALGLAWWLRRRVPRERRGPGWLRDLDSIATAWVLGAWFVSAVLLVGGYLLELLA